MSYKLLKAILLLFFISTQNSFSQTPSSKGSMDVVDTLLKRPPLPTLSVNKKDSLVYYWNKKNWFLVGTAASSGAFVGADLPLLVVNGRMKIPEATINADGYATAANVQLWNDKWGPAGNSVAGGSFLGTNNPQPLIIKTNGSEVARISGDGNFRYSLSPNAVSQTGTYNLIYGYQPTTSNNYTLSGGFQTIASGLASVAVNRNTTASGSYSFACNSSSIASGLASFAANNAEVRCANGAGFGAYNEIATDANDRIFLIGNGSSTLDRYNILTVLKGSVKEKPLFGFNVLAPTSTLQVGGSVSFSYVAKTADYTATDVDYTIHFTSGTSTFTLPTAVGCAGRVYVVKNTSGNTLTLATTSAQTIDGSAPGTIGNGNAAILQSTGSNWIKIN